MSTDEIQELDTNTLSFPRMISKINEVVRAQNATAKLLDAFEIEGRIPLELEPGPANIEET